MRIVYVLNTLAVGGAERQVLGLAGRMAARGHSVSLLVLKPRDADGCTTTLDVVHLDIQKTVRSMVWGFRRGVTFLRAFRPDLIHSHNFHGNMLARLMRVRYRGPKLISTIHNVYEGGWARMLAYRLSDPSAPITTAVSGAVAERYTGMNAVPVRKCVVVTNGIDTVEFTPDAARRARLREQMRVSDEFVWLWTGRLTAAKDVPNLLEAFGSVWRAAPRTQLWMAGQAAAGSESHAYHGLAMPHGAMDGVRRLGLRSDVAALLDAADGFVLASAWEGMPLAIGEAMAMEKPVVATDVGGVRELVGDAGALVPSRDADALSGAMLQVMQRLPEERAKMGRIGRKRILENFDMDRKADEWEALYRSVCGHRA